MNAPLNRIEQIIIPAVNEMGYDVVRIEFKGSQPPVLQIMAEPSNGSEMTVNDCELISNKISLLLDVEDPISSAYNLEVSSPGIDRPLTRLKDFINYVGHKAKIELKLAVSGQKRCSGVIKEVNGEEITMLSDGNLFTFSFENVSKAKLVLTDELIKKSIKE